MNTLLQILTLLGAVTLFLFGLSLLSNGLQKVAGDGMRRILAAMTSNPFTQILTSIGVTALIQSSTATTIMVVSFVNAGLLELGQAIGVIMGANIGTTITAWILAVFGFSFNMADFAFPLLLFGYILLQMKKNQKRHDINNALKAEHEINACRDRLREEHINNIESPSYNYQTGVYYMDIVSELERMGDYIINVSEAILEEDH